MSLDDLHATQKMVLYWINSTSVLNHGQEDGRILRQACNTENGGFSYVKAHITIQPGPRSAMAHDGGIRHLRSLKAFLSRGQLCSWTELPGAS